MTIVKVGKRITLGLLGAATITVGAQSASAIDLFKKGCCNHGSGWVSHSAPHTAPAYPVGRHVPVAVGYQYAPVGPSVAVTRQLAGSPPDPVPRWARPPGTVPVIAVQAPDPRWVHPSALARQQAAPTPYYSNQAPGAYGPVSGPYGAPAVQSPYQPMPLTQPAPGAFPGQPLPAAYGQPGVTPLTSTNGRVLRGAGIVPVQAVNPDALLDDAQPVDPAPAAPVATPGAANGLTPVQPRSPQPFAPQPFAPQPFAPQPLPAAPGYFAPAPLGANPGAVFPQAPGYGQPAPGYPQAGPGYGAPSPNATSPYVMAPQPYGAGPRSPAHNSKIYGFDDSAKRPPGTLGKTYQRPTRMLDWDKHPRVGQLDVEILDTLRVGLARDVEIKVTAKDMYNNFKPLEGYLGEDNVWHFESEPLVPTVPHIDDVRFELIRERSEFERRYGRLFERIVEDKLGVLGVRRIRLIPGRIVDLVFY